MISDEEIWQFLSLLDDICITQETDIMFPIANKLTKHYQATRDLEEAVEEYLKYLDSRLSIQCWSEWDDGMEAGYENSKNKFVTIFKSALPNKQEGDR